MTTIRCSSLPVAWLCPSSTETPTGETVLNLSSEPAECGTAFHRWIAAHIAGEELDQDALAKEHGVDADELRMLCAMGAKAFKELGKYLTGIKMDTEVALRETIGGDLTIHGTGDLVGVQDKRVLVVDWKTGRLDTDHYAQLMGYALAAIEGNPGCDSATLITVYVRQGTWDVVHVTLAQAHSWAEELHRRMRNGRGNFNPGGHCQYCPRSASCPGRREMVRAACADLQVVEWTPETRLAAGPKIGEALGRMKVIENVIEQFRSAVKADVLEHGPLPTGPGRQLAILTVNKRVLDAAKARPVLARFVTEEEIDAETTISASGVEAAAVAKAAKGHGASVKRAMAAALEQAGAISFTQVIQLREGKAE